MHYALADYVLDIVQNALEAGSPDTTLEIVEHPSSTRITVRDHGRGMSSDQLNRCLDPFYTDGKKHPGRKVGLGLPFAAQLAAETGGTFGVTSAAGSGTTVELEVDPSNVDVPPLESLPSLFLSCFGFDGAYELRILRERSGFAGGNDCSYRVARSELIDALGEIETAGSRRLAHEYLASLEGEDGKDDVG